MMMRLWIVLIFVVALGIPFLYAPPAALAAPCGFSLGFKALHDLIPAIVGACLVDEHHDNSSGDSLQETTGPTGAGGLLVWRKADNWTAYTDGSQTWINGPFGLERRFNTQRFLWEGANGPGDFVPESPTEAQTCAALPGSATGPIAAACFGISSSKLINGLGSQSASPPVPVLAPRTAPVSAPVALSIADIDGQAILVADDGQYLGIISSNQLLAESICNEFGRYGNPFSSVSIRDEFGRYGCEFASLRAYNSYASNPPRIFYHQHAIGYLTKNDLKANALDPDVLIAVLGCATR